MDSSITTVAAFWLYTLAIVSVGLFAYVRRKRGANEDFFLASRELGPWVSALSASASSESGWVMIGLVGTAFATGISCLWLVPGCIAGYLFNWYWLANRLRAESDANRAVTIPDLLGRIFNSDIIRFVAVVIVVAAMLGYVAAQMNAAGKAFGAVFGYSYRVGVLLATVLVLLYTASGGFRAVCWTDFLQAILMVGALVVLPVITVFHIGGPSSVFQSLRDADPDLLSFSAGNAGLALIGFVAGWVGIGLGYPGQVHVLVRFMATRDTRSVRIGGRVALAWSTLVFLGAILLGLCCRVLFGSLADAEQALPIVAVKLLPGVFAGLMLAAVLAAICSTADSQILVCVSAVGHDLYRSLFRRRARLLVRATREMENSPDLVSIVKSSVETVPGVRMKIHDVERPDDKTSTLRVELLADRPSLLVNVVDHLRASGERNTKLRGFEVEEKRLESLNRWLVVLLGFAAMCAAMTEDRVVFTFVLYAWSALGASFGPVLILALAWRRMTTLGALAGMITGSAVTVLWKNSEGLSGILYELVPAFVLAFLAAVVVSLIESAITRHAVSTGTVDGTEPTSGG